MAPTAASIAMEAARGALLATHAATGLASAAAAPSAVRLCRAAEGLLRTALAQLAVPRDLPTSGPDVEATAKPRRRRRPRGRGRKSSPAAQDVSNSEDVQINENFDDADFDENGALSTTAGGARPGEAAGSFYQDLQAATLDEDLENCAKRRRSADPLRRSPQAAQGGSLRTCTCGYDRQLPRSGICAGCGWRHKGPRHLRGVQMRTSPTALGDDNSEAK